MPRHRPRFTEKVFTYLTPEQLEAVQTTARARGVGVATLIRLLLTERLPLPAAPLNGTEAARAGVPRGAV